VPVHRVFNDLPQVQGHRDEHQPSQGRCPGSYHHKVVMPDGRCRHASPPRAERQGITNAELPCKPRGHPGEQRAGAFRLRNAGPLSTWIIRSEGHSHLGTPLQLIVPSGAFLAAPIDSPALTHNADRGFHFT
jgi:hypothetical protein